jgi:hypothetical protein
MMNVDDTRTPDFNRNTENHRKNSTTTLSHRFDLRQLIRCVDYMIALPKGQAMTRLEL